MECYNFEATNYPCEMPPALLLSGPRESGKSLSAIHRILKHLWFTNGARFAVVGKTTKNAKEAGVIRDFTEFCIPQWLDSGLHNPETTARFDYTTTTAEGLPGPKVDGATRTWYFRIRNYWGTESELQLHSLEHDHEVEDKFKNTRFSGIYFPELDKWTDSKVFDITFHQLRMIGLLPEHHLWIADTNPSDQGKAHFAYRLFYEREIEDPADEVLYRNFKLIEMFLDDNPWLSDGRKQAIKALYRHDPDLYERYVNGRWVKRKEQGCFFDVFSYNVHVKGECLAPNKDDWEILIPNEGAHELITGWDLGDANHSAHIISKAIVDMDKEGKTIPEGRFEFSVLDELVFIQDQIKIEDFTIEFLEKMDYWEVVLRNECGVDKPMWRHWSDQSAWAYRSAIDACDELLVRKVSKGRILLTSPHMQKKGSVEARCTFLRRLLYEQRLYISANCFKTIEMFKNMRDFKARSEYKHPRDSLSYAICAEEPAGVMKQLMPSRIRTKSGLITVGA